VTVRRALKVAAASALVLGAALASWAVFVVLLSALFFGCHPSATAGVLDEAQVEAVHRVCAPEAVETCKRLRWFGRCSVEAEVCVELLDEGWAELSFSAEPSECDPEVRAFWREVAAEIHVDRCS